MSATDPNLEALARGVASAQGDAAEAKTILRGSTGRPGALAEIEVLKADVRHVDNRLGEARELFSSLHRQLDLKMDIVLAAVKAVAGVRPNALVTAVAVTSLVVLALSGAAIACTAVYAGLEHHSRQRMAVEP